MSSHWEGAFTTVRRNDIELRVATLGEGPLILCVHGWPELWYSWRHQLRYFANQGYRVAAMDVRGYGGSSKPPAIEGLSYERNDRGCRSGGQRAEPGSAGHSVWPRLGSTNRVPDGLASP